MPSGSLGGTSFVADRFECFGVFAAGGKGFASAAFLVFSGVFFFEEVVEDVGDE